MGCVDSHLPLPRVRPEYPDVVPIHPHGPGQGRQKGVNRMGVNRKLSAPREVRGQPKPELVRGRQAGNQLLTLRTPRTEPEICDVIYKQAIRRECR